MSAKFKKRAYIKLVNQDLKFLDKHCPNNLELDHIKSILKDSISWYYPDKYTCSALTRIQNRLTAELKRQKEAGKEFLTNEEIDDLIDRIIKESAQL